MQYFEDISVGATASFGHYAVTREEVTAFAAKYDPQPFHLSDEAAAQTHFGRLSASGWHTCAMVMAMVVENLKANRQAGLGSPGIDMLKWLKPVYPGDTISAEMTVLETRVMKSKPHVGLVLSRWRVFNQEGEDVMTMQGWGMFAVRHPPPPDAG